MKLIVILGVIAIVVFSIIQIYSMSTQNGIESYPYKVIENYDAFEVRSYEAALFTSVKLTTNKYEEGSSRGFSILAGYIFGGNETKEKIAMTSPVTMSLEDSMTMMFMVPKAMDKTNLPKPNQTAIEFVEVPAKNMAAIRFGGWSSSDKIEKYKKQLISALEKEGVTYTNRFYFFGYNPPFEVVNRRNEVLVELSN